MLHERIGTELIAFLMAACGIKLDQVAGYVLYLLLCFLFQSLPRSRTECAEAWRFLAVAALVFGYFVEAVDAHIHLVVVLIHDAYHLLIAVANGNTHETGKLSDAVIHMYDEVARLHFLKFFHGERHLSAACGIRTETVFMEAVEYLMVGEDAHLHVIVGKAAMQGFLHRLEIYRRDAYHSAVSQFLVLRHLVEDIVKALVLLLAVSKDI